MAKRLQISNTTFLLAFCVLSACSKSQTSVHPVVPSIGQGPEVTAALVPKGTSKLLPGPASSTLNITNLGKQADQFYVEVEAALSPDSFAKIKSQTGAAGLKDSLAASMQSLQKIGAIEIDENAEVGYLTFWLPYQRDLFVKLKEISLPAEVYINPLSYDLTSLKQIKKFTAAAEGFSPRGDTTGFSGLSLIHAPEFVKLAEASIPGAKIDGSSVRIGITDTGITYRHPTFKDAAGNSRIVYLKDFTREGRMYFNPAAKFDVKVSDENKNEFTLTAEYLETGVLPSSPDPAVMKTIADKKLIVSDELKKILLDSAHYKVMFSLLREASLQSEEDIVDINANGSLNDEMPTFLVQDLVSKQIRVFTDFTATYNFTKAVGLQDFNASHQTTPVFAESIGFQVQDDLLLTTDEKPFSVMSASIVGYDPGNHGSHVAGIAAGRKTISNDSDDTLARGVAPNAKILLNRVCSNNGGCNATRAMIDLAKNGQVEVINMSLGGLSPFNDGYGAQETVVNRLSSVYNILFMISAGNSGPGRQTVGSPSVAKLSLSIGAAASRSLIERQYQYPGTGGMAPASPSDDEFMLFFSSRGPTAAGGFKPNVSAPGTELSSVQLNAAPGSRAGLDVYWGTSMAAPAATGAYALLMDAIKKFNIANPADPLTTDAMTLRNVIIQSARPFAQDQFTWMDEGTGMIDLVATWKALLALRAEKLSSGVTDANGKNVTLEYDVITSMKNPNGTAYDGSRVNADDANNKIPAFGSGVYLNANDQSKFFAVNIGRHLTEKLAASAEAGDLTVSLVTSAEEFVLKTDFGKDGAWLTPGVRSELDCENSATANLRVLGRGATVIRAEDGTGTLNSFAASMLNVCVDRAKIAALGAGDHGALIYAYRTDGTKVASIPSFVVPVSISIPHQSLAKSTAYEINAEVKSFQVSRNYVVIPKGTQVAKITVEVPELKGNEHCSGVELMDLEGGNTLKGKETRAQMRVSNCTASGAPVTDAKKRTLVLNRVNPKAGMWELHVFGSYSYQVSNFRLRVDYLMSEMSIDSIEGKVDALKGNLTWKMKESSMESQPDSGTSTYTLNALYHKEDAQVKKDEKVLVDGPLGKVRVYPADVRKVLVTTGGAPGDDIDLDIIECTTEGKDCKIVAQSGGSTDVEQAVFAPKAGMAYAVRVTGYKILDEGKFFSEEALFFEEDQGTLAITDAGNGLFAVQYGFTDDQLKASKILNQSLFVKKQYDAIGVLTLRTKDGVTVGAVPVAISSSP